MKTLFTHGHLIIDGNREYIDGALLVDDDKILDVFVHTNHLPTDLDFDQEINLNGHIVMPGFFDSHIHGGFSYNFNNLNIDELNKLSYLLAKKGTTSFLTTLTNNDNLIKQLELLNNIETTYAKMMGIHLEGPFINPSYRGAIDKEYLLEPDIDYLDNILNINNHIKQMTIAPELKDSSLIMKKLKENNIKVMLGHSGALKEDIKEDYDGFTHLFNATRGLHHRDISLVNLAFADKKYVEIIADGIHLDLNILKLIYKNIDRNHLLLISDGLSMAGLADGNYIFENSEVIKDGLKIIRKEDNKLCGGASFIVDGLKNMYKIGASYNDLLLMSSLNAYRLYDLDKQYGSLIKGKYADIVVLDDELNLLFTYLKGEIINA